jgi:hypothetical protein
LVSLGFEALFCRLKPMPRRSPELIRAQARLRSAHLLVQEFRARIAQLAREGKPTGDAKVSLEICQSALTELAEREARLRKERRDRYKSPKKPAG